MIESPQSLKTKENHSEKELVERSKKGDQLAFKQLVTLYEQQVRKTVIGMLGDTVEAKDVAQEVFIRFYKALKDFRGDAKVGTYLTRIAINLSLNEIKRRKSKQRWMTWMPGKEQLPERTDNSNTSKSLETRDWIEKALVKLEPEFRAVVVVRLIDGYSVKEAAEILNLPIGTIASRLARGQKKLIAIMKELK